MLSLRHDSGITKLLEKNWFFWLGKYNVNDKWIVRSVTSGLSDPKIVAHFKNHFAGRVVEEKEKSVRIRMDDSSKHILMMILEEEDNDDEILVTATWQVIPADFEEEQYENKSGWVYVDYWIKN